MTTTQNSTTKREKIGVFLSSMADLPESYIQATKDFGKWIGSTKRTLIYGGTDFGLMQILATNAKETGAYIIGVIPDDPISKANISTTLDVEIMTSGLADRKEQLIERSDILVALPGGIGTVDEIFSCLSMDTLNYTIPPLVLYNIDGCWDSLLSMLEDLHRNRLVSADYTKRYHVANNAEELYALLNSLLQKQ